MSETTYNRPPRKVHATNVEDANDVIEYPSISAAAKAIEGQVSQRNVRALLQRTMMKNDTLLGRKWTFVTPTDQEKINKDVTKKLSQQPLAIVPPTLQVPSTTEKIHCLSKPYVQ